MGQGVVECCSYYFRGISYSNGLYLTKNFCFVVKTGKFGTFEK